MRTKTLAALLFILPGAALADLSIGVNEGFSSLSNAPQSDSSSYGTQLELQALASWRLSSWILQAGGGWFHSVIAGTGHPYGFGLSKYDMTTDAGAVSLSPAYCFTDHIQAGPVTEVLFGSDLGFSPDWHPTGRSWAWLAGAQAFYEFQFGKVVSIRPGARYLVSLNVPGHTLQTIQASVQIGFPLL